MSTVWPAPVTVTENHSQDSPPESFISRGKHGPAQPRQASDPSAEPTDHLTKQGWQVYALSRSSVMTAVSDMKASYKGITAN